MTPPYEDLSRLRAGELPPDEAAALRRRIDTEPALARARLELDALVEALGALPETPPPPELDARVLGRSAPARPASWGRWGRIAAGAALAAALLLVVAPRGGEHTDRITLVEGRQLVDGEVLLLAGDLPVAIDGRARITVEPVPVLARGPQGEGGMKVVAGTVAGAAAGVLVTVAVLSGSATVTAASGEPVVVEAGEVRTFRPEGERPSAAAGGPVGPDRVASLEAEVTALRQKLAEAEFTSAVARGQVAAAQGDPVPWPAEPGAWEPGVFEANLQAEIAKVPGVSLRALDCSEFPCIVTMTGTGTGAEWQDQMRNIPDALARGAYPNSGVWLGMASIRGEDGQVTAGGFALTPRDVPDADAVGVRTDWRAKNMLEELEQSLATELRAPE